MDIHIFFHHDDGNAGKLDRILALLQTVIAKEATMSTELDALTAQVAANTSVEQSAVTLIQDAAGDRTKATTLAAQLKTSADALAAAITANTTPPAGAD